MQSLVFKANPVNSLYASIYKKMTGNLSLDFGSPLRLINTREPEIPNDKYVKIKTRMCGICGTDLGIIDAHGTSNTASSALAKTRRAGPLYLGHEIVGEVVKTGGAVDQFQIGDRVTIGDENNCEAFGIESCEFCKGGLPILCINKHKRNYYGNVFGGWSEYFVRHQNQLFLIPDEIDDELAVLMETAAVSLHAVLRCIPNKNDHILVIGGGAIGLGIVSAIRALRTEPIKVTVLARHQFQRNMALKLGADHAVSENGSYEAFSEILQTPVFGNRGNQILNNGFHSVYDCVFNGSTINDALRWLRPRGSLVAVGISKLPSLVDFTPAGQRELNIIGVHGYAYDCWEGQTQHAITRCIEWASKDRLDIKALLTHKYPLREYKNAIETASSHYTSDFAKAEKEKSVKVAFDYSL